MSKTILVTGASGFIGSHTCVELLQSGFNVVALDNLCNSSPKALDRVGRITGKRVALQKADIRDRAALDAILAAHQIDAVIHFAGLKAVGESVEKPLLYFNNNVSGTINATSTRSGANTVNTNGTVRGTANTNATSYNIVAASSVADFSAVLLDVSNARTAWYADITTKAQGTLFVGGKGDAKGAVKGVIEGLIDDDHLSKKAP